jgi:pimeloyl-ACP methyl ester carboxylesterase
VLVHGLFMGRHAMLVLATRLRREGFEVQCFGYNTVTGTLDANVAKLRAALARDGRPLALVGHSLGGLVSLRAAQGLPDGQLVAMVLLGSPYQGAQAAQGLRRLAGPAGTRIGRSLHDWAALDEKPTVAAPVFTLSGTQSAGLGRLLCRFTEPNDGTVTLAETLYPGATSCVMPVSHTGMLFSPPVAKQVAAWLQAGV